MDGIITATEIFIYLGSMMHFTLRDTYDITNRIKKASQMMGALKFYWHCPEVSLESKVHIYKACIITILLWGAETWAFTPTHGKRLEVFHHRSLRSILQIKWQQMKEERRRFGNIMRIQAIICERKLTFI